jgi:hypothetical protein
VSVIEEMFSIGQKFRPNAKLIFGFVHFKDEDGGAA